MILVKNKKVIFIEPLGAPDNIFAKFMTIPLLGPVYLGTIASSAGYDVEILNENIIGRKVRADDIADADVLCLSCITATVNRGKEIAQQYKMIRNDAGKQGRTIIGGIHASMLPQNVMFSFDHIVVGEAEGIILDLLEGRINDHIVYGQRLENLDTLPRPDFTLIKNHERMTLVPVMTSRGCPYDCNFCSVTEMFGRGYRVQSPERVWKEISIYNKKRQWMFFADDHFAADFNRTNAIIDLMIAHEFKPSWSAQVRTEVTKKESLVAKMRKAGCRIVFIGLESVNPKSLLFMNKRQSVDDIKRAITIFRDNGIMVHGMFILGSDTDTSDVFSYTSDFCSTAGIDFVQYSILTPLPGTKLYRKFEKENRLLHKQWHYYDALHTVFKPQSMSPVELQRGMIECFSDFYSYTNAAIDSVQLALNTIKSTVTNIYKSSYFPSGLPAFMKIAGRNIINSWVKGNKSYLNYLNKLIANE